MRLREKLDRFFTAIELATLAGVERLETGLVFNPLQAEMRENPYPIYRELRKRDPFHRSRPADGWILSRYDDVLEAGPLENRVSGLLMLPTSAMSPCTASIASSGLFLES